MLSLGSNISATQAVESKYSASFDGTSDYLDIGDNLDFGTADFSISLWFKAEAFDSSWQYLLSKYEDDNNRVDLLISNLNRIYVVIKGGGNTVGNHHPAAAFGSGDLAAGKWIHIVYTIDRSDGTSGEVFYVNGVPYGTASGAQNSSQTLNNTGSITIGAKAGSYSSGFEGQIDEVAIFNTVLDANAVAAIYNSGSPINLTFDKGNYDNSSALQGYWRMGNGLFDDKAQGSVHDQGNAVTGSELITNGTFTSNTSNWTAGSNQIPAESALTIVSNQLKVTLNSGDTFGNAHQAFTVVAGATYQVVGTLVSKTGGASIKIDRTATSSSLVLLLTTTASATPVTKNFVSPISGTLYVSLTVDDDGGNAVFDNISIKKVHNPGFGSNLVRNADFSANTAPDSDDTQPNLNGGLAFNDWVEEQQSGLRKYELTSDGEGIRCTIETQSTDTWHNRIYQDVTSDLTAGDFYEYEVDVLCSQSGTFRVGIQRTNSADDNTAENIIVVANQRAIFKEVFKCVHDGSGGNQVLHIYPIIVLSAGEYYEIRNPKLRKLNGNPGLTSGGVTFSSDTP